MDLTTGWDHCDTNRRHNLLNAHLLLDAPPHVIESVGLVESQYQTWLYFIEIARVTQ
jgi:hypothetical protein